MDHKRATAFAGRLLGLHDQALLSLMIGVGHRTGLFAALAGQPAVTSGQLAVASGLLERYVREWLAVMVAGRIVDHDGARGTFALPPEHAAGLTGAGNFAAGAPAITALAAAQDELLAHFQGRPRAGALGSGQVVLEASDARAALDQVLPRVPGLGERLVAGASVADLGGRLGGALGAAFPASRCLPVEPGELGEARFDLVIAAGGLHAEAQPEALLGRIFAGLRPGGHFVCREVAASSRLADNLDHPRAAALYALSICCSLPAGLAGGGAGLGLMWGQEWACELFARAGFQSTAVERAGVDPFHQYLIAIKHSKEVRHVPA